VGEGWGGNLEDGGKVQRKKLNVGFQKREIFVRKKTLIGGEDLNHRVLKLRMLTH